MNLIPAIDLREGHCVRLYQGQFDQQTDYDKNPVSLALEYESIGFTELHVVDLDGARSGQPQNEQIVRCIAESSSLRIQLGGGIRSAAQIESWLSQGVSRIVIGTLAITQPDLVGQWLSDFDSEKIVLALDVAIGEDNTPRVVTHGWTQAAELTLFECIDGFVSTGFQTVLCTDISRDGALTGPNVELYAQILQRYPNLELQASGGVRDIDDLKTLRDMGAPSAISGRALLDGRITSPEIKTFLLAA